MSIASVCSRKARHRTERDARKALAAQRAGMPPCLEICPLLVYKCPHCPYWHLGHELPAAVLNESLRPKSMAIEEKS